MMRCRAVALFQKYYPFKRQCLVSKNNFNIIKSLAVKRILEFYDIKKYHLKCQDKINCDIHSLLVKYSHFLSSEPPS